MVGASLSACNSAAEKTARTQISRDTDQEFNLRSVNEASEVICGEVSFKDGIGKFGDYKQFVLTSDGNVFIKGELKEQFGGIAGELTEARFFDKCNV
jgi:hypothetical protein